MILVDTSVWIDHLRSRDPHLGRLLRREQVLGHSFVLGEIALGSLQNRHDVINALQNLPQASIATDAEVLAVIERNTLFGTGIGYVDAHLLCSIALSSSYTRQGTQLWTRDKRLAALALKLDLAYVPAIN